MSRRETPKPPARARTRARVARNGDVLRAFDEVDKLPPEERRAELLKLLWVTYCDAADRHYLNKHGDEVPNPDGATIKSVAETLQSLWVQLDEKQQKRAALVDLAIFKGGKATG
ncbi:MAG TPA: hypothetical protein VM686_00305 [Polyangiaceae bacterium]|jgi:hypothetical protein|nr:hypothetical protein [Polyangiaceae bacterium]